MVAQVGTLVLALERCHREHEAPLHADAIELGERRLVVRDAPRRDVVEQHPHRDAALHGALHGREESLRRLVERHDVELDVHERRRGFDVGGHRVDRCLVVADERRGVAAHRGQRAEGPVLLDDRGEPGRPRVVVGGRLEPVGALGDHAVDLALSFAPRLGQLDVADQEEEHDADEGDEEDGEQPCHRCGGLAIARDDDQRGDADRPVGQHQHEPDDRCDLAAAHLGILARRVATSAMLPPVVAAPRRRRDGGPVVRVWHRAAVPGKERRRRRRFSRCRGRTPRPRSRHPSPSRARSRAHRP